MFRLETLGAFRVPEYKGALFRGGFGQYFRDLVCTTRMPTCSGCPHLTTCAYSLVFETPVIPDQFTVLKKYPNAPHPFVMVPPLDSRTDIPARTTLDLEVTLIGRGVGYLPHFIRVIEGMGGDGFYGGRFRIRKIVSALQPKEAVYDGVNRRILAAPLVWEAEEAPTAVRRLSIEFLTPLRLRTEGRYNLRPDFVTITQALLRRIHLLSEVHGDGSAVGDHTWTHELLRKADQAKTLGADFRRYSWARTSGRDGRRVQMDGAIGRLEAEGDLSEIATFLRAGEWLGVGSGTSMGMGKYRMRVEE